MVLFVYSIAYAFGGHSSYKGYHRSLRYELLSQLPEDKEMLFHKAMREVRQKGAEIRKEIKQLHAEIKDILTAPEFNEALFIEKTKRVYELRGKNREAMNEAIMKLAKQFTPEERKILVKLLPFKGCYGRSLAHRAWKR